MKHILPLFLASVSPLFYVHFAHAAEKTTLPTVTVTAKRESDTSLSVDMAKEKTLGVAGSASVVDAKEFKETRATTVKDMLDYTPGVFAQSRVNEESRLSIRGSGLSRTYHLRGLNLYQDNIPINFADGSGDFQEIDPLSLRYVEVYKGANALRFGSATLGGAVNFVTPTGYDASPLALRLEGGSFGTMREQLSSGKVIGDSDYFASISNLRSDGFRDFSDQNNTRFFSNVGHKINDQLETRFYFTYGEVNQELPGSITKAQLKSDPTQANANYKNMNYQRDYHLYRFANKTTWHGDHVDVNGGVYTTQKSLYHPIFQVIDQDSSQYGAFADSTFYGKIAGMDNDFTIGTNLSQGMVDAKRYVNLKGSKGALTSDSDQTAKNAILYAENRLHTTDSLTLIAGSQFIYAKRETEDNFLSNGNQSGKQDFHGTSPKIGAIYDISPEVQLFGNLSAAYEPPTFSELEQQLAGVSGFNKIDAQKSATLELGTRGTHSIFSWDASVYHAKLKDELMMYSLGLGQTGVVNADSSYHQGLELGLGAKFSDAYSWWIAYSYNRFRFDNDAQWGDNDIPGAPSHYIRSEFRYDNPLGFYLAPNVEVVPQKYAVDMANTLYSDAYAIFGLKGGYKLTEKTSIFFDARNLGDKKYAATTDVLTNAKGADSAMFTPGEGRSIYAGITYAY